MKSAIITTSCVAGVLADVAQPPPQHRTGVPTPAVDAGKSMRSASQHVPEERAKSPTSVMEEDVQSPSSPKENKPETADQKPTAAEAVANIKAMDSEAIATKVMKVAKLEQPFSMTQYQDNDDGRAPVEVSATYDPYTVLLLDNVSGEITATEVKAAYKALAMKVHPDSNADNAEAAAEAMKRLSEAKDILCDEEVRAKYDSWKAKQDELSEQRESMPDFDFRYGDMPRYGSRMGGHMRVPHQVYVMRTPRFHASPMGGMLDLSFLTNMLRFGAFPSMGSMSVFDNDFFSMVMGRRQAAQEAAMRAARRVHPVMSCGLRGGDMGMGLEGFPTGGHVHMSSYSSQTEDRDGKQITTITKTENGHTTKEVITKDLKTGEVTKEIIDDSKKEAIEQQKKEEETTTCSNIEDDDDAEEEVQEPDSPEDEKIYCTDGLSLD